MGTAADAARAFMACVPGADAPGSRRLRRCAACSGPIGVARPSALCSDDTRDKREGADEIAIHLAIDAGGFAVASCQPCFNE
jgi:hypothetical protein